MRRNAAFAKNNVCDSTLFHFINSYLNVCQVNLLFARVKHVFYVINNKSIRYAWGGAWFFYSMLCIKFNKLQFLYYKTQK